MDDNDETEKAEDPVDADSDLDSQNRRHFRDIQNSANEKLEQLAKSEGISPETYKAYDRSRKGDLSKFSEADLQACRRIDNKLIGESMQSIQRMQVFTNPVAEEMKRISDAMGRNMVKSFMPDSPALKAQQDVLRKIRESIPKVDVEFPKISFDANYRPTLQPKAVDKPEQETPADDPGEEPPPAEPKFEDAESPGLELLALKEILAEKQDLQIGLTRQMVDLMAYEVEASKLRDDEQRTSSSRSHIWGVAATLVAAVGTIATIAAAIIR